MDNISITGAKIYFEIPLFGGIPVTETQINSLIVIAAIWALCLFLTHGLKVRPASKRQIVADYAKDNTLIHQLVDLALLQNGMLKGAALNDFVKRSVEVLK